MIRIGLAGDVMLGRLVNEEISHKGYAYPWGNVLPILQENHLNIVNLECALTTSTKIVPKVFNFKADPEKVEVLKIGNIGVVNIANNHILDFSIEGLIQTIKTLDSNGIHHVGAGINEAQAQKATIVNIEGIKIGIIGYTDNEPDWKASAIRPGINYIRVGDINKIKNDIKQLKDLADFIILSIHWGPNMKEVPSISFQKFAHDIIDTGVDLIHGHSAHVVQGIEIYKNKIILYDTGDFIDDYMVGPKLRNDYTFLFRLNLQQKQIASLELLPAIISNMQVNKATGPARKKIVERMQTLSRSFGTEIEETEQGLIIKMPL